MSVLVTYDVECDWPGCDAKVPGVAGRINPRGGAFATCSPRQARWIAELRDGWSRRKLPNGSIGDVCGKHRRC